MTRNKFLSVLEKRQRHVHTLNWKIVKFLILLSHILLMQFWFNCFPVLKDAWPTTCRIWCSTFCGFGNNNYSSWNSAPTFASLYHRRRKLRKRSTYLLLSMFIKTVSKLNLMLYWIQIAINVSHIHNLIFFSVKFLTILNI